MSEVNGGKEIKVGYDTVYVKNSELSDEIKPHYKRPLYFITNTKNGKNIIRKAKGRNWEGLNNAEVVLDYGSIEDLDNGAKDSGALKIEPATGLCNELRYFRENPNEDVRVAYRFFKYGVFLATISILVGILSLLATIWN
jgi:hypothetical protein